MAHLGQGARIALLFAQLCIAPAAADENLVKILSPSDGAKLQKGQVYTLEYDVGLGGKAEHVHLFIDGDEIAVGHKLRGEFKLGPLEAGSRKICVAPVNKNHTPVGTQACITVTIE